MTATRILVKFSSSALHSACLVFTGLTAKILDVKTMPDVYGAFDDFTRLLGAKVCTHSVQFVAQHPTGIIVLGALIHTLYLLVHTLVEVMASGGL
jgi:hypothetical protein